VEGAAVTDGDGVNVGVGDDSAVVVAEEDGVIVGTRVVAVAVGIGFPSPPLHPVQQSANTSNQIPLTTCIENQAVTPPTP